MKALLYKQLRLVRHPMTLVFALFGAMTVIPAYPYTVAYFYVTLGIFFMYTNIREQRDAAYSAILPVCKGDTVRVSILFCALVELASVVLSVPFCMLSVRINPNGGNPVGLDANAALLAAALLIFTLFNAIFFPAFYQSGYKVGKSYLKAVIPTGFLMLILEALPHFPHMEWLNETTAAANSRQLPLLAVCLAVFAAVTALSIRTSVERYEKVDL